MKKAEQEREEIMKKKLEKLKVKTSENDLIEEKKKKKWLLLKAIVFIKPLSVLKV